PDGLELCMSGGLTHSMVQITRAQLDREADPGFALQPKAAATSATLPHNRGIEGNVRSKSLDLFVVLDLTAAAARDDPDGFTFDAARSYVRYLRARDRAGIVTFGPEGVQLWSNLTTDRSALDRTLANLASAPRSGEASLFEATELAARQLSARTSRNPGRIVVLTFDPPSGSEEEAREGLDQVLDLVERNPLAAFDGFTVDVVYVSPAPVGSSPTADFLNDLAVFTRGQRVEVPNANTLEESLANLRGDQVGSFILLYDMTIPADVGKAGTVFLDVSVSIPGSDGPRVTSYRGPLRIANAPNP
ncbi:MAG: VWA domain-containing protein, partial [Myxococcota bacterium]